MSFSADWLALREPHDAAARTTSLVDALAAWAAPRGPLEIVDLGSGTGSNLRWLAPRLAVPQRWRLVERDPALVRAGAALLPDTPAWSYVVADLAAGLDGLVDAGTGLVTASALIDLVSAAWLDALAALVIARRCALLVVLTYDGRTGFVPAHALDPEVTGLLNAHQRADKGFGPALGPAAAPHLAARLAGAGGRLMTGPSDWVMAEGDRAIQAELARGYAAAATELAPARAATIAGWCAARLAEIAGGRARMTVGHTDLLWLPG
jgi:hypothetical protein